jgi:hypothetical protein
VLGLTASRGSFFFFGTAHKQPCSTGQKPTDAKGPVAGAMAQWVITMTVWTLQTNLRGRKRPSVSVCQSVSELLLQRDAGEVEMGGLLQCTCCCLSVTLKVLDDAGFGVRPISVHLFSDALY